MQVAEELVKRTKLLSWMLKRLKVRDFDSNKSAVGEVLAVLLQSSQANVQKLAEMNGIDILLQVCVQTLLHDICSRLHFDSCWDTVFPQKFFPMQDSLRLKYKVLCRMDGLLHGKASMQR
jgi:hypothetical protein